jgi:hypothetical protein
LVRDIKPPTPSSHVSLRSLTGGSIGNRLTGSKPPLRRFNIDTLLAAKYSRKTDNCGCFSFQNYIFQVDSPHPLVNKTIVFLFGEKIGFKVYYDVKFPEFLNKDKKSHMPQVTKRLIHDSFSPVSNSRNL